MRPRRLTRQESAARTRSRLLDVAAKEFLKRGYAGASLEHIAESAGYSKGAVYGNFAGKEELCMAVLDQHYTDMFQEFAAELAAADQTVDARMEVLERWWTKATGDNEWRVLGMEFAMQARQNRALRARHAEREARGRQAVVALLQQQYDQLGMTPPMPIDQLAIVVIALLSGIAIQRAVDPSIPDSLVADAIRALLFSSDRTLSAF
jgi:AcrR family transcriptional regulator